MVKVSSVISIIFASIALDLFGSTIQTNNNNVDKMKRYYSNYGGFDGFNSHYSNDVLVISVKNTAVVISVVKGA